MVRIAFLAAIVFSMFLVGTVDASQTRAARQEVQGARKGPVSKLIELERRKKDADDPRSRHIVIEEACERHPPLLCHERLDAGGVRLDRRVIVDDLAWPPLLSLGHHP